jgi:hypothetical protein
MIFLRISQALEVSLETREIRISNLKLSFKSKSYIPTNNPFLKFLKVKTLKKNVFRYFKD